MASVVETRAILHEAARQIEGAISFSGGFAGPIRPAQRPLSLALDALLILMEGSDG